MGPKYEHFKFSIGDSVQPKIMADARHMHRHMQIVERLYQECPGGVQLHYRCRCAGLIGTLVDFIEIEIEPYVADAPRSAWGDIAESTAAVKAAFNATKKPAEEAGE
jgi:hypothetical protein